MEQFEQRVLRPSKTLRWQSVLCTVGFITFGVVSTVAAIKNTDGSFAHPDGFIVICWLVCGPLTAIGILMLLFSFGWSLVVEQNQIRTYSLWPTRHVALDRDTSIQWRSRDEHGRIFIRSRDTIIKCELYCFTDDERLELIAFFRDRISLESQTGWTAFHKRYFEHCPEKAKQYHNATRALVWLLGGMSICFILKWVLYSIDFDLWIVAINLIAAAYLSNLPPRVRIE